MGDYLSSWVQCTKIKEYKAKCLSITLTTGTDEENMQISSPTCVNSAHPPPKQIISRPLCRYTIIAFYYFPTSTMCKKTMLIFQWKYL